MRWGSPEDSLRGGKSLEADRGSLQSSVWLLRCGRLWSCSQHIYPVKCEDSSAWIERRADSDTGRRGADSVFSFSNDTVTLWLVLQILPGFKLHIMVYMTIGSFNVRDNSMCYNWLLIWLTVSKLKSNCLSPGASEILKSNYRELTAPMNFLWKRCSHIFSFITFVVATVVI